ncbi:hypothetical protein [Qipengyuania marisflavi]|uniref:DUF4398 domain-containing protein n=1 Tax=Qipengyuania marisflavi TaxID=2486356 RepID=A0A5S3PYS0_9SPHN|nr:hypothetical protein [Qipengyuania marisflavi]TMM48966.1 hypothetical protein FEV51_06205 [Qipengyuania marisflavi]
MEACPGPSLDTGASPQPCYAARTMMRRCYPIALCVAPLLGGCATSASDRYPSLATRDIERAQGQFEPVASTRLDVPPVETGLVGDLGTRLAALVAQAREAHADFTAAQGSAARLAAAARGSSAGSDSWAAAQVALADLDSARSQSAIALGDLDILFVAASVEAQDRAAIDSARAQVIDLVKQEDAVLEQLRAQVR